MDITAPLSGRIVSINIEAGQSVEEDDEIIVIEAMKMETPIYAPADGTITDVLVSVGDEVDEDDVLAIIE